MFPSIRHTKGALALGAVVPSLFLVPALVAPPATLAMSLPPKGENVATVYCNKHRRNCAKVYGAGPRRYARAPRGYSRRLRCRWYDTGYGSGLGVVKIYCIRRSQ